MNYRTKIFWIDNVILTYVIASIAEFFGYGSLSIYLSLPVLAVFYWRCAIKAFERWGTNDPCVHCGGPWKLHSLPLKDMIDGVCTCRVPNDFCPCTGYQPSRRWLDNHPKENRDGQ